MIWLKCRLCLTKWGGGTTFYRDTTSITLTTSSQTVNLDFKPSLVVLIYQRNLDSKMVMLTKAIDDSCYGLISGLDEGYGTLADNTITINDNSIEIKAVDANNTSRGTVDITIG